MTQKVIKGNAKIASEIKTRRKDMGLTIEEAASRAGVGTKTWCRYEAGEAIRKDKVKGVCKALNWRVLPGEDDSTDINFDINEYKKHEAWSKYLELNFGEEAAIAFVIGSDILLDYVNEDLEALSRMPKGSHVGEIDFSLTKNILPEQFLTRYDYDFLFCLRCTLLHLIKIAGNGNDITAHSVIQELAMYLIAEEAEMFIQCVYDDKVMSELNRGWVYDIFDDMDVVTWLYSDIYLTNSDEYHFENWTVEQFYIR